MILIKGLKIPKIRGIALFPFVILREKSPHAILINHEKIHLRQQVEMLLIFFYLWYVIEWFIHFMKTKNFWAAYQMISFEKEAYAHEYDLSYLKKRRFWAFLKWL
ncbi:MAG: hypothetical protein NXI00_07115 [Cytophagales bacterium]|nr:hypothetical protein [Cytophagales bacterium]